jgi:hypothetical protein
MSWMSVEPMPARWGWEIRVRFRVRVRVRADACQVGLGGLG